MEPEHDVRSRQARARHVLTRLAPAIWPPDVFEGGSNTKAHGHHRGLSFVVPTPQSSNGSQESLAVLRRRGSWSQSGIVSSARWVSGSAAGSGRRSRRSASTSSRDVTNPCSKSRGSESLKEVLVDLSEAMTFELPLNLSLIDRWQTQNCEEVGELLELPLGIIFHCQDLHRCQVLGTNHDDRSP